MRRGQKLKTRARAAVKPTLPLRVREDPLATLLLTHYLEVHCEWMAVTGYSQQTVETRRRGLRAFIAWTLERGLTDPREVTKPILELYQRHLYYYRKANGGPLSLGSQLNALRAVRTFFKWLVRENHIPYNPTGELELPRVSKHLPRAILSVQEVETLLNEANPADIYGLRDRALLELLYSTGLRRMEAAKLARYDVDFTRGVVFVREGKGRTDRVVPVGARALAWLEKYLLEARAQLAPAHTGALFVTDYGEPASAEFVAARVRRYKGFAGIEKPGAAHLLRHACATHMLEGGADIRYIQALLGHANLQTTEIYTHVSIDKLKAIHAATHPARLERASTTTAESATIDQLESRIERRLEAQDSIIFEILGTIRQLMASPEPKKKRPIGFVTPEEK